jgi:hypothetical protein
MKVVRICMNVSMVVMVNLFWWKVGSVLFLIFFFVILGW